MRRGSRRRVGIPCDRDRIRWVPHHGGNRRQVGDKLANLGSSGVPPEPVAQEHPGELSEQPGRDNQLESLLQQ
jgi:hypothetical protein